MIRDIHVWLWGIVAELEHLLYPWKNNDPPSWAVERYSLDHSIEDHDEKHMYYDWLLSQEQKIQKIEKDIIGIHKKFESMEENDSSI